MKHDYHTSAYMFTLQHMVSGEMHPPTPPLRYSAIKANIIHCRSAVRMAADQGVEHHVLNTAYREAEASHTQCS